MVRWLTALHRRLQSKIISVAPLIAGAMLLVGVLSVVLYALEPHLPATYRAVLEHARQGDLATTRDVLRSLLDTYGQVSIYVFMLAQVLQVLMAPVPGQLLGLLGGSLFGFWQGLLFSGLALGVGSFIAMGSSRLLGEGVIRRVVPSRVLSQFDHLVGANGLWSFFLVFLLPIFPDDAVCLVAGLTRLPLHRLLLVCVLGRLPGIAVLTFVGSAGVGETSTLAYLVLGVAMLLAFGVWLFSDEVEALLNRFVPKHARTTGGDAPTPSTIHTSTR